ncbi:MAG: hypothetical protein K8Q91_02520 [Candidatus Vogelbacteria bacterium]|nr:hypothetical protein [Candidatus Vogelbacteria bacterium]
MTQDKITSLPNWPLYKVLGQITILWSGANIGYYWLLPLFGYQLSYNSTPIIIALYFLIFAVISIFLFWDLFSSWVEPDYHIWLYILLSLGFSATISVLLYGFSFLPVLQGFRFPPYTDILFATPWYFLPKATDILLQQVLITALILAFHFRFECLKKVAVGYILIFGGAHIILFILNSSPTPYAIFMTLGSIVSGLFFPYLLIRVRGGFVYNYVIHFSFYLILATTLHLLPPPGYGN